MKPSVRESSVEKALKRRIEEAGGRCLKLWPFVAGVPDRIVLLPDGWLAFVEVKSSTGQLRPAQKRWRAIIEALGFRWYLVRCSEDTDNLLAEWVKS